jgi:transposase InsO family protein
VLAALQQALGTQPARRTIFHSDRGSQYASSAFRAALADAGMLQSMSPSDARLEIFQYIDGYYNTHRKHSSLGYLTPSQFESSLHSHN